MWHLALAALLLTGPATMVVPADDRQVPTAPPVSMEPRPLWQISMQVKAPVTTTDPEHVAYGLGVARTGTYRIGGRYQPSETSLRGAVNAFMGVRLLQKPSLDVAFDLEYTQVWADRRLFRGIGWQLEGHDRRRLSLGIVSAQFRKHRYFGAIEGIELGLGRMYIRRLVTARAGATALNSSQEPILVSSGWVGMAGVRLVRPLFWGLTGDARARVIGGGRSRGGEVPFAQLTVDWDIMRPMFQSQKFGHGFVGLTGNHATSSRSASYFQNGIGLAFRVAF